MIELKLNIDITDRFENAVRALADALVMREKLRHEYAQGWERVTSSQTPDEQREGGPEKDPTPAESEPAKESESRGVSDEAKAGAKAQKTAPERVAQEVTPEPKPTEVTPEPEKAQEAVKNEDSMQGMDLMQAVKAITDELRARGVEIADANARVRRRANELGLSYGSCTCLVKAIGYAEARRVALGE